jgi:signal transduction histidine kinase
MRESYTILLVEDDVNDLQFVRQIVFQQVPDAVIISAASFQEAKEIVQEHRLVLDACLLDLTLPDCSGEELIEKMLEILDFIPMIILTRLENVRLGALAISKGAADLLLKGEITPLLLQKSILYSIERARIKGKLYDSEQRYSALFFHSPHPQWLFDVADQQITKANNAAVLKYGFTELDFSSMRISDLKPKELYDQALVQLVANEEINKVIYLGRFRHLTKMDTQLHVDMYASPLRINNRNLRLIMAVDQTDRMYLEEAVKQAVIDAQERERYELGAELHDNVKQILVAGQLSLDFYMESLHQSNPLLSKAKEMFEKSISEIRVLSHRLAPVIHEGSFLKNSIEKLVKQFPNGDVLFSIDFCEFAERCSFSQQMQLNLFRITQEQISNTIKHAQAKRIQILFQKEDDKLVFCIKDDGVGFNTSMIYSSTGIGFSNIERRAKSIGGEVEIQSKIGKGCCLRIVFDTIHFED